jgi:two-component system response regulator
MASVGPILLVEDNPDHAELTTDAIRQGKTANPCAWVEDAEAGLDYLYCRGAYADRQPGHPALVLLDLRLPGMDGLDMLERVRQDDQFTAVPIVILTTSSQEAEMVRAYSHGANSYVVKPVAFDEFQETVRKLKGYWVLVNRTPGERGAVG